jgi:AraC-like DNA-binding protein
MLNRSEPSVDPLSHVLDLLDARCALSGELVAGGQWARRFENRDAIKFCAATAGSCWYYAEGMARPVLFEAGSVLVTNGVQPLVLASDPSMIAGATTALVAHDHGNQYQLGQGADFVMLGGIVVIAADQRALLQSGLPPIIHVRGVSDEAAPLLWLLSQLSAEMNAKGRPGQATIIACLTQLLFVQTLRAYMMQAPASDKGWLKGLGDKRLAIALEAIHNDPAHNWDVDGLAKKSLMSRTAFAVRFREIIGVPPLTYLTQWRMQLAQRALRAGASVSEAALSVGYSSESAFSSAFKRQVNVAPGEYRRNARETK